MVQVAALGALAGHAPRDVMTFLLAEAAAPGALLRHTSATAPVLVRAQGPY
jgi:hypothetical protein